MKYHGQLSADSFGNRTSRRQMLCLLGASTLGVLSGCPASPVGGCGGLTDIGAKLVQCQL